MKFSKREEMVLREIEQWEQQHEEYQASDFGRTYQHWIDSGFNQLGEMKQKRMLSFIDTSLFQLHALIQQAKFQQESRKRLLEQAQVFDETVETISDMNRLTIEQLTFLANQQAAKQRLYALGQGGLSGFGGIMLLGIDLPSLLVINLRSIQLIALTYGYDVKHPTELMIAYKLFHAVSLPKEWRKSAWDNLFAEVSDDQFDQWLYDGSDEVTDPAWLTQPLNQAIKVVALSLLKKKIIQGVPLLSVALGASINYRFTKQTTEAAHYFYQKRYLLDKYK